MKALPAGAHVYKSTAEFTEATIPAGLLRAHVTKPGVWGRLVVSEGTLLYRIVGAGEEWVLDPETPGVIEPEVPHEVAVLGPVRFRVEFSRVDDSQG